MPKKVRQLKAMLKKAGFRWRPGRGSHTVWDHPSYPEISVTVSGNDGDDAHRYQEKEVNEAIEKTKE
jgi:predicted RNA binding protein YcfA (HicA-like mRNA interferase family)